MGVHTTLKECHFVVNNFNKGKSLTERAEIFREAFLLLNIQFLWKSGQNNVIVFFKKFEDNSNKSIYRRVLKFGNSFIC
jgi:hypothetical protein